MVSIFGIITLFLRLALAIQSHAVEVFPLDLTEKQSCVNSSLPNNVLDVSENNFANNISLVRKLETEEKDELEGSSNFFNLEYLYLNLLEITTGFISNPIFGNKPLRGSQPPLYDLFHSWKIHLS